MWLGLFLLFIGVMTLIGSAFAGGVFTIILIPVAVVALVAALLVGTVLQRAGLGRPERRRRERPRPPERSLRPPERSPEHAEQRRPGHVEATPEDFLRARQRHQ